MDIREIFLLNIKKLIFIFAVWFVSVILHSTISGSLGIEERGFFIITTLIIPIYFIISAIYSFIFLIHIKVREKKANKTKSLKLKEKEIENFEKPRKRKKIS